MCFFEKTKQGQHVLQRDYPDACVFRNVLDVYPPNQRKAISSGETNPVDTAVSYESTSRCMQHGDKCKLIGGKVDLSVFGSPCVDDSPIGCMKKEGGNQRPVPWMKFVKFCVCFPCHCRSSREMQRGVQPQHVTPVEATMAHLHWLQEKVEPALMNSENVVTGNISEKICEKFSNKYHAKVFCLKLLLFSFPICVILYDCIVFLIHVMHLMTWFLMR